MNLFNIERSYQQKAERGWSYIYVVVDLHGTLIKPFHTHVEFYPGAAEVIRWFNRQLDVKTILWTSSYPNEIEAFLLLSAEREGIKFDFVNQNPLQPSSPRADFSKKFYMNVILDDKAGFEPETDWAAIKNELIRLKRW